MHLVNDANPADLPSAVGHRRWTLNPFVTNFSYGQVGRYGTQKVLEFASKYDQTPQINVDFVAFPYETYPFNLLIEDPPWSFSVIVDKKNLWNNEGDFFRNATITVTRVSDNTQLTISNRYTDTFGYGLPNFMSWKVNGWEYDTLYEVEIKNVILNDGTTRDYSYSVFIKKEHIGLDGYSSGHNWPTCSPCVVELVATKPIRADPLCTYSPALRSQAVT